MDDRPALDRECQRLTRYLIGTDAPPDVRHHYTRGHALLSMRAPTVSPRLDAAILRLAGFGPGFTRAADAFAAIAAKGCTLRRKIVLLVAILESRGQSSRAVDSAVEGSRVAWFIEVGLRGAMSAVFAILAVPPILAFCVVAQPGPTASGNAMDTRAGSQ